jgi:hypothetical protein
MPRSPDSRRLPACILFAAALLGGCATERPPVIAMSDAVPPIYSDAGTDGSRVVLVTLDIRNDNPEGLPLDTIDYAMEAGGGRVFSGRRACEQTLRPESTHQVRVPAVVPAGQSGRFRLVGSMTYLTPGRFAETLFDAGLRVPSVSFTVEGDLPSQ